MSRFTLRILLVLTCLITSIATAAPSSSEMKKQVQTFINQMVSQHHFNKTRLEKLFSQVKVKQRAVNLMNKPYEAKPWFIYRKHFISERRIKQGAIFWHRYKNIFQTVSKRTGIPAQVLVAIVGVETHYGTVKGGFSAFNVLYTLAFYYPRRATFFRKELREFLLLCREQGLNPLKVNGSYAGALGQPQFMPSSYRMYARAYDGGKKANLFDNEADVISSIANYFAVHGWQAGQPIAIKAIVTGKQFSKLPIQDRNSKITRPKMSLNEFHRYGVRPTQSLPGQTKATFMRFDLQSSKAYWFGFKNFYVITRYNTSKLYAMAVYQLSEAIRKQYKNQYGTA
jgi:membrane-bound lytic murein transglycosylase B